MFQQQPEAPQYVLEQKVSRAVVPKILSLFVLGAVFYIGILLNIALLDVGASEESIVKTVSLLLVLAVVIVGIYMAWSRSHKRYLFYANRVAFIKKVKLYSTVTNTTPKQDFFDKMFKTYSINLGDHFYIRHIPQSIDLQGYLQRLTLYAQQQH